MEFESILIFLISVVSTEISRTIGEQFLVGNVQVLQQHPKLRNCAVTMFYKNQHVGGRISESDGKCEGLSGDWGLNETVESGYGYFKKVNLTEEFNPPLILTAFRLDRVIPVTFRAGAKITVTLRTPANTKRPLEVILSPLRVRFKGSHIQFAKDAEVFPIDLAPETVENKVYQVSFLAETNAVKAFVNGNKIGTFTTDFPLSGLDTLSIQNSNVDYVASNHVYIHSFMFIAA